MTIKISGSSFERSTACPASINLKENIKNFDWYYDSLTSDYASEGTEAHKIFEHLLKENYEQYKRLLKEFIDKYNYNAEVETYFLDSYRYVQEQSGGTIDQDRLKVEYKIEASLQDETVLLGIIDILYTKNQTTHIFDFKWGEGIKIHANDAQLLFYSCLVYALSGLPDPIHYSCHVIQPRLKHYEGYQIKESDIIAIRDKIKEIRNNLTTYKTGDHCQFCPAKIICPEMQKNYQGAIDIAKNDNIIEEFEKLDNNVISDYLDKIPAVKKFITALEHYALEALKHGKSIPNYKLVKGRGRRVFNEKAEQVLTDKLGEGAYEKSLITLTKAESLLNKQTVAEITTKRDGKVQFARVEDKREAIEFNNTIDGFDNYN